MTALFIATMLLTGSYLVLGLKSGFSYLYNCYLFAGILFFLIAGIIGNVSGIELYDITLPLFIALLLHSLVLAVFSFVKATEGILFILPGLFFLGCLVVMVMSLIGSTTSGFRMLG